MIRLPVGGLSVALLLTCVGCSVPSEGLRVQARVEEDVVIVAVPALVVPTVNVNAGFSEADSPMATPALHQIGSFSGVAAVAVGEGDTVAVGQELARLDDALLAAAVKAAKADAAVAKAQIGVVDAGIDKTYDKDAEIADKRGDVNDAIDQLKDTRTTLKANRKTLQAQRDTLDDQLDAAKEAFALLPPEGTTPWPPGVPTREAVEAGIHALKAGLKQIDAALKQMKTGLGKLDDGLQKANDGLDKLDDATDTVSEARAQLTRLRRLVVVAADLSDVVVSIAKAQRGDASVTSPAAGVVTRVATVGQHLSPGAALVTLRRFGDATMTTWLSPTQAATVCVDDAATVHADWMSPGASVQARVTRIASRADFPPTSQATDEIHLTRAFTVWLTSSAALPAGTPVTVTIQPCRETP
ncbi:MAG: HlyD family efflux transporter periplasmic adaptor subunit [Propionicimonas sp.]